jgi:hypothetical protein
MTDNEKGITGTLLALLAPYMDFLGLIVQISGGLLGLYLLFLSIKHKKLQLKQMRDRYHKKKQEEEEEEDPENITDIINY